MSAPQIAVVGLGAWGSALALHCARNGAMVTAWTRRDETREAIYARRELQINGVPYALPSNLHILTNLTALPDADCTIIALPAHAWGNVVPQLASRLLVSAAKGIEPSSGLSPLSYLATSLKIEPARTAVLSGPSFASDLAANRPLSLVAASASAETANRVAELLCGSTVRVYTSTDPLGVEIGGIFKNVIAIAAGVSDALGLGPSARASLISRGLAEMIRLATAMGVDGRTLTGLSGLGDLIMTATEDQSRNRTVGLRLGRGEDLSYIISSLGSTAEGVRSAPLIQRLARDRGVDVPITDQVVRLIGGGITATELTQALLSRPRKSEF